MRRSDDDSTKVQAAGPQAPVPTGVDTIKSDSLPASEQEILTLHIGATTSPARENEISPDFIREMSNELGVSPSRLELIMR